MNLKPMFKKQLKGIRGGDTGDITAFVAEDGSVCHTMLEVVIKQGQFIRLVTIGDGAANSAKVTTTVPVDLEECSARLSIPPGPQF